MRYELLLQASQPGVTYDLAKVEDHLTTLGVTPPGPDGTRIWKLRSGEVEARTLVEGGQTIATVLKVPLSDKLDLVRELMLEGLDVATATGTRLVDPQLAKSLTLADEASVADSYMRSARYAGQYAGVSEAIIASYGAAEDEGLKPGTKLLIGAVVFFGMIYMVVTRLVN